ncbi:putative ribonuclease H-like domain-containing protein [Tanacetum coccineum]
MMGIPNEHQLKFNSIKDAKKLLEAVEKRFGGNEATKKTQRNLLKQQYENFTAPSSEMLDQTFDRLQKLVSQLELLGEKISQEDVNQKLLRSLSPEWNTHAVVWRNKANLDTMSMDDLYNNLKVYEPEVKGMSSSSSSTQNMAFVSSSNNNTSSTNEAVNTAHGVSTASTQVNAANSINIDNLSDAVICAFFASQPNSPQLIHEDLQQIHPDDMEEMDLRWQMAMLTMRARRDILLGSVELQEIKTTMKGKLKKECACGNITSQIWCHVMVLVDMVMNGSDQARGEGLIWHLCFPIDSEEFVNEPVVKKNKAMYSKEESKVVKKNDDAPIIDEWVSDDEEEDVSQPKTEKKTIRPSIVNKEFVKSKQQEKTSRKTVKQVEQHRQNTHRPRGNQRNLNNMMSQKLGSNFEMFNKACYVCGSFDHLQVDCNYHQKQFQNKRMVKPVWNNAQRVNHQNFAKKTHPCAKKNLVPRAVLMKSGLVSVNTARQNISKTVVLVNTARQGNPQMDLQDKGVINSGCSRHMIGNMSYLTYYEEIDGGYVAFGGTPKEEKSQEKLPLKLGNLVRGLPSKLFENDQTCVACQKGKQHRASCKSKTENSISLPLHLLHIDLFGPTFVKSLMKKMYCLVVTNDYSRFTWVFFLATKDETSGILKSFIIGIENLVDHKVKVIRCDNGTEFKNREMNQFCKMKGILRQFSVARTPQQNGVAERRNRTLIEAARTMLADSKLPTTFWAEAVNTACYVQNRVLVVKPHNKTPYELFHGRTPTLSFMRPFGCPVTILNTIDHLGKFDGKADEGFFVGYSLNSKAFRVFNSRTRIVEENLHIRFSESTPNVVGSGPDWLFDIDALTKTMNYEPIVAGKQSNSFAGTKASDNASQARKETEHVKDYILLPLWTDDPLYS